MPAGPHSEISVSNARDQFTLSLFDLLWESYRERVPHVAAYERLIEQHGARFDNDHIAFRTLASQTPYAGIGSLSRLFEALGYVSAGCYTFADKQLSAIHFQHPHPQFPKLFISEFQTWRLPSDVRAAVERSTSLHTPPCSLNTLAELEELGDADTDANVNGDLLDGTARLFTERPWPAPERTDVELVNEASQYAAWVLVHGYQVNHFTSLINSHEVAELDDIEKTSAALAAAGVPMKAGIEGALGSKLRQTATAAAMVDVPVRDGNEETTMPWTYAYFELAERGEITNLDTGTSSRFEGFLGPQATHLFEMTRRNRE